MALDTEAFKTRLAEEVSSAMIDAFTNFEDPFYEALKSNNGGFETAMLQLKVRSQALASGEIDPSEFEGFIRTVMAEEWSKAITSQFVASAIESLSSELANAISESVGSAVDEFIRSIEVRIPAGIPVRVGGTGSPVYTGQTIETSEPGEIS